VTQAPEQKTQGPILLQDAHRRFLHQALKVVGAEHDECTVLPSGGVRSKSRTAWRRREHLKKSYAAHTDAECEELRAAVSARETEVAALRRQVEQMERTVTATRNAAARRDARLRKGTTSGPDQFRSPTKGSSDRRSITAQFGNHPRGSTMLGDIDLEVQPTEDMTENWRQVLANQNEMVEKLEADVKSEQVIVQKHSVQVKAAEASLFVVHAELLHLRAKAQQTESRVTRLANELRRVYQRLPETVQQQLLRNSEETSAALKEIELQDLKSEYRHMFYKFMGPYELEAESTAQVERLEEMSHLSSTAIQMLHRGQSVAEKTTHLFDNVEEALRALQEAWDQVGNEGPSEEDFQDGECTDAQLLLHRARICSVAVRELVSLMEQAGIEAKPPEGTAD